MIQGELSGASREGALGHLAQGADEAMGAQCAVSTALLVRQSTSDHESGAGNRLSGAGRSRTSLCYAAPGHPDQWPHT